jgi:Cu2+-exporting ATPase
VHAHAGTSVFAGTLNRSATLRVRVDRAGETTRLAKLLREVESSAARRAPVVRSADRLSWAFVAVVLALAALTWALWAGREPAAAIDRAIALLIVTCPCALALATPLAITVAIGRAARGGILIKGGDALEALGRGGRMVLDKTGTLTTGRPTLLGWSGPDECRAWVLALERDAAHPVAQAFRTAWPGLAVPEAREVRHTIGGGIEGVVGGRAVVVGSPAFVAERCSDEAVAEWRTREARDDDNALTPVWVAIDGRPVAQARFGDAIRPEAFEVLAELRRRGWRLELLSGDDPAVASRVGAALGFAASEIRGGASPEDKLRAIEKAAAEEPVVMVGDGVNDAAAMARATVGIGVHGGAEACLAVADIYLAGGDLRALATLEASARRTLAVIRRNIAFSLAYNVVGAALAIAGVIDPLIAAILMPASSLTVVLASWHGRTFDTPRAVRAVNVPNPAPRAAEPRPAGAIS